MPCFIDTIKLADGNCKLIYYHNRRINDTMRHFFGAGSEMDIEMLMSSADKYEIRTYKCRLIYSKNVENIKITSYVKVIAKLRLIDLDAVHLPTECIASLGYGSNMQTGSEKFFPARIYRFNRHTHDKEQYLITDTSFANIILLDGKKWITPNTYLLDGIKMYYFLDKGGTEEKKFTPATCNISKRYP